MIHGLIRYCIVKTFKTDTQYSGNVIEIKLSFETTKKLQNYTQLQGSYVTVSLPLKFMFIPLNAKTSECDRYL